MVDTAQELGQRQWGQVMSWKCAYGSMDMKPRDDEDDCYTLLCA